MHKTLPCIIMLIARWYNYVGRFQHAKKSGVLYSLSSVINLNVPDNY